MSAHLLEVRGLTKVYRVRGRREPLHAVDGVSLYVDAGETLGLVGESGCGKSTLGRAILRLDAPTAGEVYFDGKRVDADSIHALRRGMQMVFQNPFTALDPRMTIGESIAEGLEIHRIGKNRAARRARVAELMEMAGLDAGLASRYPHELSGGQRQRAGIARALAVEPRFLICDEPVSALDVSAQAQILNTLLDLQERLGLACLFIAHDLAAVRQVSHRIAVMYLGRIVESGPADDIVHAPRHPYTRALLDAAPVADPQAAKARARHAPEGEAAFAPEGFASCPFCPRCRFATEQCARERPTLCGAEGGRLVACHHPL